MKTCILCGDLTTGSIGAAGLRWKVICQPCKNREDAFLLKKINAQVKTFDVISRAFVG